MSLRWSQTVEQGGNEGRAHVLRCEVHIAVAARRRIGLPALGHEEPTILLTNHLKLGPVERVTRCAQRMLIENGISEAVQFFHIDALSSIVGQASRPVSAGSE